MTSHPPHEQKPHGDVAVDGKNLKCAVQGILTYMYICVTSTQVQV